MILLSGRPESTRADTENWLARHGIEVPDWSCDRTTDRRPAADLKADLITESAHRQRSRWSLMTTSMVVGRLTELGYRAELFR